MGEPVRGVVGPGEADDELGLLGTDDGESLKHDDS